MPECSIIADMLSAIAFAEAFSDALSIASWFSGGRVRNQTVPAHIRKRSTARGIGKPAKHRREGLTGRTAGCVEIEETVAVLEGRKGLLPLVLPAIEPRPLGKPRGRSFKIVVEARIHPKRTAPHVREGAGPVELFPLETDVGRHTLRSRAKDGLGAQLFKLSTDRFHFRCR